MKRRKTNGYGRGLFDAGPFHRPQGLPAVSLFSGAGGLDLGLESAGGSAIRFCGWVEKNEDCQATLRRNNKIVESALFSDIVKVTGADIMDATGLQRGEAFLVAGGPPCQAFSTAGLRRSIGDERGQVVPHYCEIIRTLRPRFFVLENVRGILSVALSHRPYDERIASEKKNPGEPDLPDDQRLGSVFNMVVLPTLQKLKYEIVYGLVNSADFGTPQIRHRLVILGSRDREFGSGRFRKITGRPLSATDLLPPTHHVFAPYHPINPWRTLRDGIGDMNVARPNRAETYSYSDDRRKVWKRIPPGSYWTFIRDNPELFPEGLPSLLKGAFTSGGGKVGFWRRLSWDRPAPTLPTQPQHLATSLCHPDHERPLSIPEYAALQDFPPTYVFAGNKSSRYEQIGNAVPVRLGCAIGNLLLAVAAIRNGASSMLHLREATKTG